MTEKDKVTKPKYTKIPNIILDNLQSLKAGEVRLIMAICRNTLGYHKAEQRLSLTFLQRATGMSRQGVINAAKALLGFDWIKRHALTVKGGQTWEYEINLEVVNNFDQSKTFTSQKSRPEVVNNFDQEVVNNVDTIKKIIKKDLKKDLLVRIRILLAKNQRPGTSFGILSLNLISGLLPSRKFRSARRGNRIVQLGKKFQKIG